MAALGIAVPLTGEDLAQQIRDGRAIFSTKLEKYAPREARPHEVPIIMRSDPEQDVEMMIGQLRREYPRECRQIKAPINNIYDYFDHYDVQLHGTGIIHAVLMGIANHNANRAQYVLTFAESWRRFCVDQFLAITPDTQNLFHPEDVEIYGHDFLEDALAYLKEARMTMNEVIPPVAQGFVPSAAASPAPFNDPAIIASQVSSRHSSGQSSTSSAVYKDPMYGQRHTSVHSEPENKILRSIRPSLLRNSSNPEGPDTTPPRLSNQSVEKDVKARNDKSTAIRPEKVVLAVQVPKNSFAEKIYAASSGQASPLVNFQHPTEYGMGRNYGVHPHHPGNHGSSNRSYAEMEYRNVHGPSVDPNQAAQRPPIHRPTGVQTMRHFDRQKMATYDAANRRLSGIAPPPPPHLIEPFPPFAPFVVSTPTHLGDLRGNPRPVANMGPHDFQVEDRQYRGFGIIETGMAPHGQFQKPTNFNHPLPTTNLAGPALSIAKTRNTQSHNNHTHGASLDPHLGPPIAIQRLPPGGPLVSQMMPLRPPQTAFLNDARLTHNAMVLASQQAWQQQMREHALISGTKSAHQYSENSRPLERDDRRNSHKRGRGSNYRNRSSPTKHQADQSSRDLTESGKSVDFSESFPQQVAPELVTEQILQEHGTQNQKYTWKPVESPMLSESPNAVSPADGRPQIMSGETSLGSMDVAPSARNDTWNSSEDQSSTEATEPKKLYISGPGLTESDVRFLVEPYGEIIYFRAGYMASKPNTANPFYFISFASEEEARRVEAALNGHVLVNPAGNLRVSKARVWAGRSQNYSSYDRYSDYCHGSRAYSSNPSRNQSVPYGRVENRSQTSSKYTIASQAANRMQSGPTTSIGSQTPPQTPKARHHNSEQGNDGSNFSGTVRRKKQTRPSVKPIDEEVFTAEKVHLSQSAKPDSNKLVSGSRANEPQDHIHSKGVKQGQRNQPSAARPALKESEQAYGVSTQRNQASTPGNRTGNEPGNRGRFDEPRTRPVSLGDFMHRSSLHDSPDRSSDQSQQRIHDGSPSRKHRKQGGIVKSKPQARKESFPALDSKRASSSDKVQKATESGLVGDHVDSKEMMSKPRDIPATPRVPKVTKSAKPSATSSGVACNTSGSTAHETNIAVETSKPSTETSVNTQLSAQTQLASEDMCSAEHQTEETIVEERSQRAQPESLNKLVDDVAQNVESSTLANPAVSGLVSESWANELSSADELSPEPVKGITTTFQHDSWSLETNSEPMTTGMTYSIAKLTSIAEPAEDPDVPKDSHVFPAHTETLVPTTTDAMKASHKETTDTSLIVKMAEKIEPDATKTLLPNSTTESTSSAQSEPIKKFYPEIPPPKNHARGSSKGEGKGLSDSKAVSSVQPQPKTKKNKKKKNNSKAESGGNLHAGLLKETTKQVEVKETSKADFTPVGVPNAPVKTMALQLPTEETLPDSLNGKTTPTPAEPTETPVLTPQVDELVSEVEKPKFPGNQEGLTAQPTSPDNTRPVSEVMPPRTSSVVPGAAPISTHKKKQKTPTKENFKKTKKPTFKKGSVVTKSEAEVSAKAGNAVEKEQSELKVNWQEPEPEPEVSNLKNPKEEEIVDISDEVTRRPDYPSLDRTNAVYCVRGETRIERSLGSGPFILFVSRNDEQTAKEEIDVSRIKDSAKDEHESKESKPHSDDLKEEDMSDLGTPQASSRQLITSPLELTQGTQSEQKKPKKKSNKKKKKTKTESASQNMPGSSASTILPEEAPASEKASSSMKKAATVIEQFVADPESFAEELYQNQQESGMPASEAKKPGPSRNDIDGYHEKKDGDHRQDRAKKMEALSTNPNSIYSKAQSRSASPNQRLRDFEDLRQSHELMNSKRRGLTTAERKIELLNTPAFPHYDKNIHGLGITTNLASTDVGARLKPGTKRDSLMYKGIEYDKFADPPLSPLTPINTSQPETKSESMMHKGIDHDKLLDLPPTPFTLTTSLRPAPTTSDFIRTPSNSTSPETIIAEGQGAEMETLQLNDETKDSFNVNAQIIDVGEAPSEYDNQAEKRLVAAFAAATAAESSGNSVNRNNSQLLGLAVDRPSNPVRAPPSSPVLDPAGPVTVDLRPNTLLEKSVESYSSKPAENLSAMAQMCDLGLGSNEMTAENLSVPKLSAMLGKWDLAEEVEKQKVLSFPASKLEIEEFSKEAIQAKYDELEEKERHLKGDEDSRKEQGSKEDDKAAIASPSESQKRTNQESLFFSDDRRSLVHVDGESSSMPITVPLVKEGVDLEKPFPIDHISPLKAAAKDSESSNTETPQHQSAKATAEKIEKDIGNAESLASFISEVHFEINPNDPMIRQLAAFGNPLPVASENTKSNIHIADDQVEGVKQQQKVSTAANFDVHGGSPRKRKSEGEGRGEGSTSVGQMANFTGRASPSGSHVSDVVDDDITHALKSLPPGSPTNTLVNTVNHCMGLGPLKESPRKQENVSTPTVSPALEISGSQETEETTSKMAPKKAPKRVRKTSRSVEVSTPNAWNLFAANVEKDEAAQMDARRQEDEKREAENERMGVATPELDLTAMNQTWRRVETGGNGHRRVIDPSTTSDSKPILDEPKLDSTSTPSNTTTTTNETDATATGLRATTLVEESEATPKPSTSPDYIPESVIMTNNEAFSANDALDTIPESTEDPSSDTPTGSPSRVTALQPLPNPRPLNTATLGLSSSFPALPPPSVFALSNSSSPEHELSEAVIERHNHASSSPRIRRRANSSNVSEYSTTSSTPSTNALSNPARRPPMPPKEASWSNVAASTGGGNVRLSPTRNPSARTSPVRRSAAHLSPARSIVRPRSDTRSSLARSVASRESEEEDTPRRGRSPTPAGSQKGAIKRHGTSPTSRRNTDEWSVPPGEKMWGSSSEA